MITHIDMSIINNGQIEIGIDVVTKITMLTPKISMKRWFKVAIRSDLTKHFLQQSLSFSLLTRAGLVEFI